MLTTSSPTSSHRNVEIQLIVITTMSEVSHGHQAANSTHDMETTPINETTPIQSPIQSPVGTSEEANIHKASSMASESGTSSPETRKPKASTFSVLSLNSPRRPALSPNTFDPNTTPCPQSTSEVSSPTTQPPPAISDQSIRESSAASALEVLEETSLADQKENQRVSPELKKQLESLIAPASRTTSQSSGPSTASKGSRFGAWSIGTSSIALRPCEPVPSIVTTQLWEPPQESVPQGSSEDSGSDRVPTPLSMSGYQSEYISFPAFESYPKNPHPGLRSRCSDKSWHLLQKLKGKIVEMHNAGLHSSRSSSRNSISSRKSRSPGRPLAENQQPHTQPESEGGGSRTRLNSGPSSRSKIKAATVSGGTLRTSAPNLKRVSIVDPKPATETINNPQIGPSAHKSTIVAVPPLEGTKSPQQILEGQKEPAGLPGLTSPLEFASSLFQSLVTIASGDNTKSIPVSPDRGSASEVNTSKPEDKGKAPRTPNQDSSEDEMSFMEYIKKFSDSSPTGTPRQPLFSAPNCDISAVDVQPEFSNTAKQAVPRTVTFKDPTYDDIKRGTFPMSPIQEADSCDEIPPEIALDPDTGKTLIKYTAEDYDTITTYFYNVQARVLKRKWPFLLDTEITYLIDSKWLEMEWEDLEDWAQESAQHVDDPNYVEPDLFEDLTLVDPRGPDAPRPSSNLS
ncbi:hypothetical protein TWF481_005273 [Arthrobotrys musiformis]|uniref:Uncharacterized protein n=1 Tax=Arthrobotrys musiformis TaxID=47236 RepID=A0AAV9WDD1_9PEZI